jgi:hypothetical protein
VANKLGLVFEFSRGGSKKQHYKITYMHQFENFDENIGEMQDLCNTFCTSVVEAIELIA